MKSKALRLINLCISLLFGFISTAFYLITEINRFVNLESLEGYFNFWGMVFVVLSFIMIFSYIPSVIFQLSVLLATKSNTTSEIIDEHPVNSKGSWLISVPSKFLRNANLIFTVAFLAIGLISFFHTILTSEMYDATITVIIISLIIIICGCLMVYDSIVIRNYVNQIR